MRKLIGYFAVAAVGLPAALVSGDAVAEKYGRMGYEKHPDAYRYVLAESQYNATKSIVAPVRHGRLGDQVLVPERGWTYCEYSCEYTLQKEHLDFWEGQQDGLSTGLLNDLIDRFR